ncbi:molecular chaperone [Vibrio cholerae]|uniref:molecular chaperone n=1 Tax=Vibrio cholerae TaxID=666 RepID=UPI001E5BB6DD|nr:molecular chaperone [Vibrio cholerae]MCD1246015.1 molecular chaperone [Vibrio cholerae]
MNISTFNSFDGIVLNSVSNINEKNKIYPRDIEMNVIFGGESPNELHEVLACARGVILKTNSNSQNKEQEISDSLLDAIDKSTSELESFKSWTDGGNAVIGPIVDILYDSLIQDDTNGTKMEDLMQLLVFDFLLNKEEWGLDSIVNSDEQKYLGNITENFGSGLHAVYAGYENDTPSDIVNWFLNTFIVNLKNSGKIPEDSITSKLIKLFDDVNNRNKLEQLARNYTAELERIDPTNITLSNSLTKSESTTHLAPTLKFFLLAQAAKEEAVSANNWNAFIHGDIEDIKSFLGLNGGDSSISDWLVDPDRNTGWTYDESGQLDFNKGHEGGIPISALLGFFNDFPSRVLSDEELKEVNRIGDNVKMIMQTLKYWYQILRDERLAVTRNI